MSPDPRFVGQSVQIRTFGRAYSHDPCRRAVGLPRQSEASRIPNHYHGGLDFLDPPRYLPMPDSPRPHWIPAAILPLVAWLATPSPAPSQPPPLATELVGLRGGLVVQLGAGDTCAAAQCSRAGHHLIHVLDPDAERIRTAQRQLRREGCYGLAWAEQLRDNDRLPYAEDIVNLIVVDDVTMPAEELKRVLAPGGSIVIHDHASLDPRSLRPGDLREAGFGSIRQEGDSLVARKPWPIEIDEWSHPRHAADGNAVSLDHRVGPPQRVRWIAAATSEVEGLVTAGGRNFYGGVLARDSFNGLRLWHRDLNGKGDINAPEFLLPRLRARARGPSRPTIFCSRSFATVAVALDGATGEVSVDFGEMVSPTAIIYDGSRLIAADTTSVRGFDANDGRLIWNRPATEPHHLIADGRSVSWIGGRVRRGEKAEVVVLDAETGEAKWSRDDYPWLVLTTRTVLAGGMLVFEVSTLNDHDDGNAIHVVSSETGEHRWSKEFPPRHESRAAGAGDVPGRRVSGFCTAAKSIPATKETCSVNRRRSPHSIRMTGETRRTYPAGLAHCFPPVATAKYMFAGELDMTDLSTGEVIANRITKANCSREGGWTPANGLIYTTPKHCTCWPMLRGFVAMAPRPRVTRPRRRASRPRTGLSRNSSRWISPWKPVRQRSIRMPPRWKVTIGRCTDTTVGAAEARSHADPKPSRALGVPAGSCCPGPETARGTDRARLEGESRRQGPIERPDGRRRCRLRHSSRCA